MTLLNTARRSGQVRSGPSGHARERSGSDANTVVSARVMASRIAWRVGFDAPTDMESTDELYSALRGAYIYTTYVY